MTADQPRTATARALAIYLRARRHHKLTGSDWVWLGTRNRGRLGTTGIRKMLIRRAAEAGPALTLPHHNGRTEGVNTRTKMITEPNA